MTAMYDFVLFDTKASAAKEWLMKEYRSLRTGRAMPAILDNVQVAAYGSLVPLRQVGSVAVEDARTLRVNAFDPSIVKDIERGIVTANLGVGTVSDSASVRVTFPELTAERREQLTRLAKQRLEEARAAIRVARDEIWKDIQSREKEGVLTEDDKFRLKDELQGRVDTINDELEKAFEAKRREMET